MKKEDNLGSKEKKMEGSLLCSLSVIDFIFSLSWALKWSHPQ